MIKKLRRKITILVALLLWTTVSLSLILVLGYNYTIFSRTFMRNAYTVEKITERLYKGKFKEDKEESIINRIRKIYYIDSVAVDVNGEILLSVNNRLSSEQRDKNISAILKDISYDLEKNSIKRRKKLSENTDYEISKEIKHDFKKHLNLCYRIKKSKNAYIITYFDMWNIFLEMIDLCGLIILIWILGGVLSFTISFFVSKLLTKHVEESYLKQKQFIADASHELKTPLSVINVNIDMLQRTDHIEKYAHYIKQESQKMNKLIDEMLVMASMDNEQEIEKKDINLSNVVEKAIQPFEAIAYENAVTLSYDIEPDISFFANTDKMERLIAILTDNAIQYADFDKIVRILMKKENHLIVIDVINSGKEISKEDQKKIFERFYRVDKSRNRKKGKYGLGLSIAQTIVSQHEGKIKIICQKNEINFRVTFKI